MANTKAARSESAERHQVIRSAPSRRVMLVPHRFGPESVAYMRSYFASNARFGRRLGRLLSRQDIEAGAAWAFIPAESPADRAEDFTVGGLFSKRPDEPSGPSPKPQTVAWLSDRLSDRSSAHRLLCIEDARLTPAALDTKLPELNFFFCGEDVYWYAVDDALQKLALEWVPLSGALADPNIAMVTTLPKELRGTRDRRSVSSEVVEEMVRGAIAVIVGAWDWEGFLIWERAGPDTGK